MFTRKRSVYDGLLLRRVAVNSIDSGETMFTGRFVEYDPETFVFEQCETVPDVNGTVHQIKGRQYVDRIHVWAGELPT